jgi:hypothetical protein
MRGFPPRVASSSPLATCNRSHSRSRNLHRLHVPGSVGPWASGVVGIERGPSVTGAGCGPAPERTRRPAPGMGGQGLCRDFFEPCAVLGRPGLAFGCARGSCSGARTSHHRASHAPVKKRITACPPLLVDRRARPAYPPGARADLGSIQVCARVAADGFAPGHRDPWRSGIGSIRSRAHPLCLSAVALSLHPAVLLEPCERALGELRCIGLGLAAAAYVGLKR